MIITAKFASTCPACSQRIQPGQSVEWTKGSLARHVSCKTTAALPISTTASVMSTGRPRYRPTVCRVCGHRETRNARGYVQGDRILKNGECQSCYDERRMGY